MSSIESIRNYYITTHEHTTFHRSILKSEKKNMANNSQKMSYHVGEAKGQAEEKASNLMEKASNAAQSAKETVQETGQQMMVKAQEAGEDIKDATGFNK